MGINLGGAESCHSYIWCGSADKEARAERVAAIRFTIPYLAISEIECSRYVSMLIVI
jgi:hypothetical protein